MIPLGAQVDNAFAVQLAELLATIVTRRHPKIATTERTLNSEKGGSTSTATRTGRQADRRRRSPCGPGPERRSR